MGDWQMPQRIGDRIERILAAIGRTRCDIAERGYQLIQSDKMRVMHEDFRGAASDAELMNDVGSVIANLGSLGDHLKKWAKENGRYSKNVDDAIRFSPDLSIVMDLWDRDKHGGNSRHGGWSKRSPRVESIGRGLCLRTQAKPGSEVWVQAGLDGRYHTRGDGTARIETYGRVLDNKGNFIGELQEIIDRAIDAWERLLKRFEIGRGL